MAEIGRSQNQNSKVVESMIDYLLCIGQDSLVQQLLPLYQKFYMTEIAPHLFSSQQSPSSQPTLPLSPQLNRKSTDSTDNPSSSTAVHTSPEAILESMSPSTRMRFTISSIRGLLRCAPDGESVELEDTDLRKKARELVERMYRIIKPLKTMEDFCKFYYFEHFLPTFAPGENTSNPEQRLLSFRILEMYKQKRDFLDEDEENLFPNSISYQRLLFECCGILRDLLLALKKTEQLLGSSPLQISQLEFKRFDVSEITKNTISSLQKQLNEANITISKDMIDKELGQEVDDPLENENFRDFYMNFRDGLEEYQKKQNDQKEIEENQKKAESEARRKARRAEERRRMVAAAEQEKQRSKKRAQDENMVEESEQSEQEEEEPKRKKHKSSKRVSIRTEDDEVMNATSSPASSSNSNQRKESADDDEDGMISSPDEDTEEKPKSKKIRFSQEEVDNLLKGINRYGLGQWKKILEKYQFRPERDSTSLRDKYRNLTKYGKIDPHQFE